ncbi:MAG: Cell division protein FtsB [Candidatus Omnitrophica bacterium ADurb.Bin277]|nr:MAG: Cell division protein FtsB [Candidatus Omnitrophica bacterium ADurb.Bin277]
MLKKFFIFSGIVLAVILVLCWIYLPSYSRYHELKQEEERLVRRIREIDAKIKALADEKYLLQNDVEYLEKVIREELGFVKPGEIIYEFATKGRSAGPVAATDSAADVQKAGSDAVKKTGPAAPGSGTTLPDKKKTLSSKTSAPR